MTSATGDLREPLPSGGLRRRLLIEILFGADVVAFLDSLACGGHLLRIEHQRRPFSNHLHDEAIRRYDAILTRYPQNVPARDERAAAKRMLQKSTAANSSMTVKTPPAAPNSEKKAPSRWNRVRRFFHGKPAEAAPPPKTPKKP